MSKTWFDLITVDVVDPRASAQWFDRYRGMVTLEDEDDGRWVVVGDSEGTRRLGFQRSTLAELAGRTPSKVTVSIQYDDETPFDWKVGLPWSGLVKGHMTPLATDLAIAYVDDVTDSARFWRQALALQASPDSDVDVQSLLTKESQHVVTFRANPKGLKQSMMHFDLTCESADFDAEANRLCDLGAVSDAAKRTETWGTTQTLTAPDGLVFCLNAYA